VTRRLSGGRAIPAGDGFVGISLALPHRSVLEADDPLALAPAQVLNRCVRGILEACKLGGVPAYYPGRDTITVDGRILAFVSFEVDRHGACLFEATLAVERAVSCLPRLLDQADPHGVVPSTMVGDAETATLGADLGADLPELLVRGYASRSGLVLEPRAFTDAERRALGALAEGELADARWLDARRPREGERRATSTGQLGVLEARVTVAGDCLESVTLAGDFIANSAAVGLLEEGFRGVPANAAAIATVVGRVFADPANFVLGIGAPRIITDTIVKALAT
jgi:hypothetical protein